MNLTVYNMLYIKKFEILASALLPNHVPGTMPRLSIFPYSDSTHFSELFGISYMVVDILLPEQLMYIYGFNTFLSTFPSNQI